MTVISNLPHYLQCLLNPVHPSWLPILSSLIEEPTLLSWLKQLPSLNTQVLPKPSQVFRAFSLPLTEVKVVILGQDPYHTPGVANGLAFSSNSSIPPSLMNIYKELQLEGFNPISTRKGDLSHWVSQGVLLLNTVLTVEAHRPNSHKGKGWEIFTDGILHHLTQLNQPMVFLLWGTQAKSKALHLTNKNHLIIKTTHPSPLSANKGWWHNQCFTLTNNYLISHQLNPIQW